MQGERLGPYLIDRELGSGGMGTVYDARGGDGSGERVALKLVHPHLLSKEGFRERFLRELDVGRRIEHPNVVRTLDGGEIDGRPYVALEYVDGQTLDEFLQEAGRVPEDLCRHIGHEIARGLEAIHGAGIVHRDLKPANVLITREHVVKVMDLGLARHSMGDDRLSMSGMFVGTAGYAPPEQFRGTREIDPRGDLYSLGALLYELGTGAPPFRGESFQAVLHMVLEKKPTRPGQLNPQLSPFFEELVSVLLAKEPARRVASAGLLADVLARGEQTDWWTEQMTMVRAETRRPLRRIRIPRETDCVGREEELASLRAAYDAAKAGDGRVVLLEGEAGIGKSRLVDELMRLLEASGEDVNFLYGSYPPGGAATAAGAFSAAFGEQFGTGGSAPYLTETPALAPAFDALLRGDAPPAGAPPLTTDSLKTVVVHATRALGRERPTIVVIDDLHFAPDEGRALFASLAMAVPGHPILLVGTARPGLPKEWTANLTRLPHVTRSDVQRLDRKHVSRLLEPLIGRSPDSERLAASIAATADGNPFFLFEIVRSLRESGVLSRADDGSWATASRVSEIVLPDTVQNLLDARIERLSDEERELLDCAACWGFEFDGRLVAEALGLRRLPALRALGRLEQEHGLVRAAGARFAFDHHAIQEHLYARLPEAMREELHAALAEALEARAGAAETTVETLDGGLCVDLCDHYLRGARGASAIRYLRGAQEHLARSHRHARLVELCDRALADSDLVVGDGRVRVLLAVGTSAGSLGDRARQEECAREAGRLADELGADEFRGRAATALGRLLLDTRRLEDAKTAFRRAAAIARLRGDESLEARAIGNVGNVFFAQRRMDDARRAFEDFLVRSRRIGDRPGEASAMLNLGNVLLEDGRRAEAQEHYERHLEISCELGARSMEATSRSCLGNLFSIQGRLAEALEQHEQCLEISREIGSRPMEIHASANACHALRGLGRLAAALERGERRLALSREIEDVHGEISSRWLLGVTLKALGRPEDAAFQNERLLLLARGLGDAEGEAVALHNLGCAVSELGDAVRAEASWEACLALCEQHDFGGLAASTLRELGSHHGRTRGAQDAHEMLVRARDSARVVGDPAILALACCELGALTRDDVSEALATFAANEARMEPVEVREACFLLWMATGQRTHLAKAKLLLDDALAKVSHEYHEAMLTNLRINREIMAAWREEFGEDGEGDSDNDPDETESVTRVGPSE